MLAQRKPEALDSSARIVMPCMPPLSIGTERHSRRSTWREHAITLRKRPEAWRLVKARQPDAGVAASSSSA